MATTKTKEELVRLAWLTELRRQGHRQCFAQYYSVPPLGSLEAVSVCALGLLLEASGRDPADMTTDPAGWKDEEAIGALAGLTKVQSLEVARRNDGEIAIRDRKGHLHRRKHTFAEIADVVAGWFPA